MNLSLKKNDCLEHFFFFKKFTMSDLIDVSSVSLLSIRKNLLNIFIITYIYNHTFLYIFFE